MTLPGTTRSRCARPNGSEPGIDPYIRVVSTACQDVFQNGPYIGKGIYDIDAFGRSLQCVLPENLILSHDLLQGGHARCGLSIDVELYEDHSARYRADVDRRYRWIRGDRQLGAGCCRGLHGLDGMRRTNPLVAPSRRKLFDSLPHDGYYSANVIVRTLWRLLEWNP